MTTRSPLLLVVVLSTTSVTWGAAQAILRNSANAVVDTPVQIRSNSAGDSVPVNVVWTATGGAISASGLYTAGAAGVYKVIAQTSDGRLADTATIVVMPAPAQAPATNLAVQSLRTPDSMALNRPVSVEIGAPPISMDCKDSPDFIRIDRGWVIMFASSTRQIRVGGCYQGRPVGQFAYANASPGTLTPKLRYESGAFPGLVTIEIGSSESRTIARKHLVVIPNLLQWGFLVWLYQLWRNRKRRPRPPAGTPSIARARLLVRRRQGSRWLPRNGWISRRAAAFAVHPIVALV
jgi:hypothetical protein